MALATLKWRLIKRQHTVRIIAIAICHSFWDIRFLGRTTEDTHLHNLKPIKKALFLNFVVARTWRHCNHFLFRNVTSWQRQTPRPVACHLFLLFHRISDKQQLTHDVASPKNFVCQWQWRNLAIPWYSLELVYSAYFAFAILTNAKNNYICVRPGPHL